jgi:uncharacterized membrane protein (UPF0127 family)
VEVARSRTRRLVGLAFRREAPVGGLLIPRCRSVHTFGLRFAVDLVWLGTGGRVLRVDRAVPPWRVRWCRAAVEVLELGAGRAHEIIPSMATKEPAVPEGEKQQTPPEEARGRMRAGFDPRQRIYRDPFNEYFVFVLSASGAALIAPMILYIAMAISGIWSAAVFVAAAAALELVLIFGVGRPAMKRHEAVGWALLWAFSAAVLGLCFFYLVAEPTIG